MTRVRHTRPEPGRLEAWQRWLVYGSSALLLASGVLWLVFHYGLRVATDFGLQPHPLEYAWLRLHGAAAMLGLVAIGSLLPAHVARAWEARKNRAAGGIMLAVFAALAATGYLLYYFATEASRGWLSLLHWGLGLAAVPALFWHVRAGLAARQHHRSRAAAPARATAPVPAEARPPANLH
jgi:cation transport ATPase